jgi:hypothetical protein
MQTYSTRALNFVSVSGADRINTAVLSRTVMHQGGTLGSSAGFRKS